MAQSDATKSTIVSVSSLVIAIFAMILVSSEIVSPITTALIIPAMAYGISLGMSSIYQYISCNTVNIGDIAKSNLVLLGTNALFTGLLFIESIPFLDKIFGPYDPRNSYSGLKIPSGTPEYEEAMANRDHYKLQFLSSIVKAVIPSFVESSPIKQGIVYFYWIFWGTILPMYFLLSIQGMCAAKSSS